jgi:hypothetical protein
VLSFLVEGSADRTDTCSLLPDVPITSDGTDCASTGLGLSTHKEATPQCFRGASEWFVSDRRSDFYPRIHRFVVELMLLALLLHAAYKFIAWLWADTAIP